WLEGGPAGNCQPGGAPRPIALAGILKIHRTGSEAAAAGDEPDAPGQRHEDTQKGAAMRRDARRARARRQKGETVGQSPTATPCCELRPVRPLVQSSSQDTEALS